MWAKAQMGKAGLNNREAFQQWQLDQIFPSLTSSHCCTSITNNEDHEFFKDRDQLLPNYVSLVSENLAHSRWSIYVLNESITTTAVNSVIHHLELLHTSGLIFLAHGSTAGRQPSAVSPLRELPQLKRVILA